MASAHEIHRDLLTAWNDRTPPTGKSVTLHVGHVVEVRDGTVYREREYMDMFAMMIQLGVATAPGAASRPARP